MKYDMTLAQFYSVIVTRYGVEVWFAHQSSKQVLLQKCSIQSFINDIYWELL